MFTRFLVSLPIVVFAAVSANAQSVSDSTFGPTSGWTSAMIQNTTTPPSSATFTEIVPATGGFLGNVSGAGPYRQTTMTYQDGGIQVAHIYGAYTYSAATAGVSIAGLNFSYALIKFLPAGNTLSDAFAPLLLQNDTYYAAGSNSGTTPPYDGAIIQNSWATGDRKSVV